MAFIPAITNPLLANLGRFTLSLKEFPLCGIRPQQTRLIIKPLMTNMIHSGVWEGPCRFDVMSVEEETRRVHEYYNYWSNNLDHLLGKLNPEYFKKLEPGLVIFNEDFKIYPDQFEKIDQDAMESDVLLISPDGASIETYQIAEKYNKPVISTTPLNCRTVDIAAYTRSHGLEMFVPNDPEEMKQVVIGLRTRKILSETRILYPTDWGWPSVASITGINEPEKLKDKFGVELVKISYKELSDRMEQMTESSEVLQKAREWAGLLSGNADHSFLDEKYVIKSLIFYQCIIQLMNEYHCNAFTIECFEFCTSKLPQKWEITPCLIHTLFKDQGIPSACEGDLAALLGTELLMSVSGKSSHLGNMFMEADESLQINHSVPGTRMNGFNEPPLPYQLGRFVQSGWGTKIAVDFMNNEEKNVTVVRLNPTADSLLVLKGKLVGSKGYNEDLLGCSSSAFIIGQESGSARKYIEKQVDYGNHLAWVYGDYTEDLKLVAEMLKMNIEIIS
jgi:L-fucose isomerase-like protein